MGGLVATLAALDGGIEPDGLLLLAPLIDVHLSPAMKAQAAVGSVLARLVPHARITPGVDTFEAVQRRGGGAGVHRGSARVCG